MENAKEHTARPESMSIPVNGGLLKSSEGAGKDLLDDDVDGRLTMEVVGSMHEVSRCHHRADFHSPCVTKTNSTFRGN